MEIPFDKDDMIVRFLGGNTTSEENRLLDEWKNESEENETYFNEYRNTWLVSLTNTANGPEDKDEIEREYRRLHNRIWPAAPVSFLKWLKPVAVAASILLALFIGTKIGTTNPAGSSIAKHENDSLYFESVRGSASIITLPDGSKVWLNSDTNIAYNAAYNKSNRTVELDGEAYFDVVTNPDKPFVVKTKGIEVKATGTTFNVRSYAADPDVTTTLIEGILHIEGVDKNNRPFNMEVKPNQTITYFAENEITKEDLDILPASIPSSKKTLIIEQPIPALKMENVNTQLFTSWKDNRWVIENDKFSVLKSKLERRFNVTFVLGDESVKDYRVSGSFESETIDEVMQILKHTIPIDYKIEKGVVFVNTDKKTKLLFDKAKSQHL